MLLLVLDNVRRLMHGGNVVNDVGQARVHQVVGVVVETAHSVLVVRLGAESLASLAAVVAHLQVGLNDFARNVRVLLGENRPESISAAVIHFLMRVIDNVVHLFDGDEKSDIFIIGICARGHESLLSLNVNDVKAFYASVVFGGAITRLLLFRLDRFAEDLLQAILRVDTATCGYCFHKYVAFTGHFLPK